MPTEKQWITVTRHGYPTSVCWDLLSVRMGRRWIWLWNMIFPFRFRYSDFPPFIARYEAGDGAGSEGTGVTGQMRMSGMRMSCHYLSNKLTAVAWESVSGKRNTDGSKYYPCASCAKNAGKGSTVYIMPSGGRYHTMQDCKAIMAYVRAVKLKEVKHLGACSYCGGG